MADLVGRPADAVALLKARLLPVQAADPERVATLIEALGSEEFAARRDATEALERLGERARGALAEALEGKPELEVKRRLEKLLKRLTLPTPSTDLLRGLRAVLVLVGSADARRLLRELREGDPAARFFGPDSFSPGFLGPMHAPLIVGENVPRGEGYEEALKVKDLEPEGKTGAAAFDRRVGLLGDLDRDFAAGRPDTPAASHASAVARAVRLMRSPAGKAFDLGKEKGGTRDAYGRNLFGRGCLLARRLVEQGVPFVEVTRDGWDTHQNNFEAVMTLSAVLDAGWSALTNDLKERGLHRPELRFRH